MSKENPSGKKESKEEALYWEGISLVAECKLALGEARQEISEIIDEIELLEKS